MLADKIWLAVGVLIHLKCVRWGWGHITHTNTHGKRKGEGTNSTHRGGWTCLNETLNVDMDWLQCCWPAVCLVPTVLTPFARLFLDRLQPNVDTRQKQLAAWCSLALSYCRHHKLYTLDVMEAQESPVFNNKKIERILTVHLWFSEGQHYSIHQTPESKILSWMVSCKTPVSKPYRGSCLCRLFDLNR